MQILLKKKKTNYRAIVLLTLTALLYNQPFPPKYVPIMFRGDVYNNLSDIRVFFFLAQIAQIILDFLYVLHKF